MSDYYTTSEPLQVHSTVRNVRFEYFGSFYQTSLEAMETELVLEESEEDVIDCEIMSYLMEAFDVFASIALAETGVGPEIMAAIREGEAEFDFSCQEASGDT